MIVLTLFWARLTYDVTSAVVSGPKTAKHFVFCTTPFIIVLSKVKQKSMDYVVNYENGR